ncbi:MAG: bifunctional DedA family/phosphatase PAP2 family protein [Actinomycetota bacterium]
MLPQTLAFDPFGWILDLHGWVLLLVVFALPALEASAFVGFLFPGEIAIVLGGVIASRGDANLAAVIVVAIAGAVIGDSIGYYVGKRWGRRMLDATLGRFVKRTHFDHAEAFLARRGGPAVFIGRWTAALRVLVPGLAGMARLRYRTFLMYNLAGGAAWATTFVILGYLAGDTYREVVDLAGRAGLLLLALVVLFGSVVFLSRWIARNPDRFREIRERALRWRPLAIARERASRPLRFIVGRFRPGAAFGLSVTIGLVVIGLTGWAFGAIVRDVIGHETARVDRPVGRFFLQHREAVLTNIMKAVTFLGSAPVLGGLAVVIGVAWWLRRRTPRPLALVVMGWAGSVLLVHGIKALIDRPRPPASHFLVSATGPSFPSGHVTDAVALYGLLAALIASATPSWTRKVGAWAGAVIVGLAVGTTRLYLGVHWLTDVLGGYALGGLWLFTLLTSVRVIEGVMRDRVRRVRHVV